MKDEIFMTCENCGIKSKFIKLGFDEFKNVILECKECGAVCYEDGTLIEGDIRLIESKNKQ